MEVPKKDVARDGKSFAANREGNFSMVSYNETYDYLSRHIYHNFFSKGTSKCDFKTAVEQLKGRMKNIALSQKVISI